MKVTTSVAALRGVAVVTGEDSGWDYHVALKITNDNPYQNAQQFVALGERLLVDRRFAPRHLNYNLEENQD